MKKHLLSASAFLMKSVPAERVKYFLFLKRYAVFENGKIVFVEKLRFCFNLSRREGNYETVETVAQLCAADAVKKCAGIEINPVFLSFKKRIIG